MTSLPYRNCLIFFVTWSNPYRFFPHSLNFIFTNFILFFKFDQRPKRFTLKGFKRYWFVCKDLQLFAFKNKGESGSGPAHQIPLRGCEVTPDVNLSQDKFGIRLEVPGPDGMSEMWIRCDSVSFTYTFFFLFSLIKHNCWTFFLFAVVTGSPIRQMDGGLPSSG